MDIELLDHNYTDKELLKGEEAYRDLHVFLKGSKDLGKAINKKYVTDKLKEVSDILTKRFGITIAFGTDIACGACTVTLNTGSNTSINRDAVDWQKLAKKSLENGNLSKKERTFLINYVKSMNATRESFVKGVRVDYKKGKIYGLNKKAVAMVYLDFFALIDLFNLTYKEVFAIILHEVGHSFTSIMYMHKISGDSVSHEESLTKWLGGDKSNLTLKMQGKKIDLTKRDSVKEISKAIKSELDYIKHTYSDSERQADGFAVSFGYGEHLASSLAKMHDIDPERAMLFTTNSDLSNMIFSSLYLFLYLPLYVAWVMTGVIVLDHILMGAILGAFTLLFGTSDSGESTYDNIKDRLEKIKRTMVRGIREKLIPKEQIVYVLDAIESVENYNNSLNIEVSVIDTIYNFFSKTANTTKLHKTLETLSENDLHYLKEKL